MKTTAVMFALFASLAANAQSVVDESVSNGGAISLEAKSIGIRCESQDKKILMVGFLPKDTNEGELTVTIDGKEHKISQNSNIGQSGVSIQTVQDVLNGVFTVSVMNKERSADKYEISLSAIPKTMTGKYMNRSFKVSFNAKLSFYKGDNSSSCEDGCIVMPVEVENRSKPIFIHKELNCLSAY